MNRSIKQTSRDKFLRRLRRRARRSLAITTFWRSREYLLVENIFSNSPVLRENRVRANDYDISKN